MLAGIPWSRIEQRSFLEAVAWQLSLFDVRVQQLERIYRAMKPPGKSGIDLVLSELDRTTVTRNVNGRFKNPFLAHHIPTILIFFFPFYFSFTCIYIVCEQIYY